MAFSVRVTIAGSATLPMLPVFHPSTTSPLPPPPTIPYFDWELHWDQCDILAPGIPFGEPAACYVPFTAVPNTGTLLDVLAYTNPELEALWDAAIAQTLHSMEVDAAVSTGDLAHVFDSDRETQRLSFAEVDDEWASVFQELSRLPLPTELRLGPAAPSANDDVFVITEPPLSSPPATSAAALDLCLSTPSTPLSSAFDRSLRSTSISPGKGAFNRRISAGMSTPSRGPGTLPPLALVTKRLRSQSDNENAPPTPLKAPDGADPAPPKKTQVAEPPLAPLTPSTTVANVAGPRSSNVDASVKAELATFVFLRRSERQAKLASPRGAYPGLFERRARSLSNEGAVDDKVE
jgi:hypothetical protein